MSEDSLAWVELWAKFDNIDEDLSKITGLWNHKDVWQECDYHHIKHHGVPGGCPLCMLRTYLEEKQRIEAEMNE